MISDKKLLLFLTPYPDEILYSVLCRYHFRVGNASSRQTNFEMWNKYYGKSLYLPDGINNFTKRIPSETGITTARIINDCTIFPLFKPFVTADKGNVLLNSFANGNSEIYNIIGFSKMQWLNKSHLCLCEKCVKNDVKQYGEAYWHRVHQIPGVSVCSVHHTPLLETNISFNDLKYEFYPVNISDSNEISFSKTAKKFLLELAENIQWIFNNSGRLGYYEDTLNLYENRLSAAGFKERNGDTKLIQLSNALVEYYGEDFLQSLDACNAGVCAWLRTFLEQKTTTHLPLYHLLIMIVLSGSAENFFCGELAEIKPHQPFGEPPYPCRNPVCDHFLKDVIEHIELKYVHSEARATFICPHCGYTYRRKGSLPKEKQYSGQIDIIDYGWLWKKKLKILIDEGKTYTQILKLFHCDIRTVTRIAVEEGFIPPRTIQKRVPYVPKGATIRKEIGVKKYRERFLYILSNYPKARRKELNMIDCKCYEWLRENDNKWFERHAPPSQKCKPLMSLSDDELLEKVKLAVESIRGSPGKPRWVNISSIGKIACISQFHQKCDPLKFPKMYAYITDNIETCEEWQHHKLIWAAEYLRENGRPVTLYLVKQKACIADNEGRLNEYIMSHITIEQ